MPAQQLDLLPNEIIQRILAYGPYSNALACRSVCRHLKTVCDDPAVYVSIIYSSNAVSLTNHEEAATRWPLLRSLRTEKDWRVCARYAQADMFLASYTTGDAAGLDWNSDLYRSWKWLPELIVTEHRKATKEGVSIFRTHQSSVFTNRVELAVDEGPEFSDGNENYHEAGVRLIFIAVCDSFRSATSPSRIIDLSDDTLRVYQKTLRFQYDNAGYFLIEAFLPMIDRSFESSLFAAFNLLEQTTVMSTWLTKADQELYWTRCMILCIIITPMIFECVLRSEQNVTNLPTSNIKFDAFLGLPPTPIDLPFLDFFQIQPLFSPDVGTNSFAQRHLPIMTTPAFLEDGEWCGYCFDEAIDKKPTLTIHNLSLEITSNCADHCTISGICERMKNGYMTLTGTLFKQTGWAQLDGVIHGKDGFHRPVPLSVMITPFGIIGSWRLLRNPTTYRPAGWLWLWKKSWQSTRVEPVWKNSPDTVLPME